ncbi:hypothetical protein AVO45_13510 [Ruegeria marisrubri]|uniref:Uncharacterized protein n=1 Tax=Ruegeria marisrubri TaxID=1685379 RepID=A0A0X3TH50_9RHOB|nr:DUF6629 family protein [Ruegeria marisrubri]KUJ73616.1 hypothetical protein AVO45_13510 [Ruegeria marisrubri]
MCFSAEASFIAGAALVGCSGLTFGMGREMGARFLPLAAFPLFFGVQQIAEGVLWLSLGDTSPSVPAAMVFLFFAYWFWPVWVPLSSALIEPSVMRRRMFMGVSAVGFGFGMLLFLPVLLQPDSLGISLVQHSIQYDNPRVMPDDFVRYAARLFYAAIICLSLIGSSHPQMRGFGYLILATMVIGFVFASYAFTSIWCFMAAIVSASIFLVLRSMRSGTPAGLGIGKRES